MLPFSLLLLLSLVFLLAYKKKRTILEAKTWVTAKASDHNFDEVELNTAIQRAEDLSNFYALVVIRDQRLIVEKYFEGHSENSLFHLRSMTKNVTSALAGIAIEAGSIPSVDVPIKTYYPHQVTGAKEAIRLRDMLNMTSGLAWHEDQEIVAVTENLVPNTVNFMLAHELVSVPGTVFNYNSLSSHVVGDVIFKSTGQHLQQYAQQHLFGPLGIQNYLWQRDPEGRNWAGFGLQLRARDMAKFGQLYLNRGRWQGRQLIPESWVDASATQQIASNFPESGYSYQWWVSLGLPGHIYFASGYGGQGMFLVPEKNMIVLAFQKFPGSVAESHQRWTDLLEQVFVPIYNAAK